MTNDVILIGNSQPAIALGDPDDDGNVRVAVFGGEQYVPANDLYKTDGSAAYPAKDTAAAATDTPQDADGDQDATLGTPAQTQPATAPGA